MIRSIATTSALVMLLTGPVRAADFTVDPNHTQATFTVTHLAISRVSGKVPVVSGAVTLGANGLPSAATITLSARDIDTESADRDRDLRGGDWFEVDKYPSMTFVERTASGTPQAFTLVGDLTMHGVTKPVTLSGKELGRMTDPRGHQHVGYDLATTIDRRDWGLNWGKTNPGGSLVAGNDVTLDINVEIVARQ